MANKKAKSNRTLDIYSRLCEGRIIRKKEEAERFNVDERTIQRDLDDIRVFLSDKRVNFGGKKDIVYNRRQKGYILLGEEPTMMTNGEVFAISKILLESRAFTKKELTCMLDRLIDGCVPTQNVKKVRTFIANEKYHYMETQHGVSITDILWELGNCIKSQEMLEISYNSLDSGHRNTLRVIEPVGIIFSEYYFYVIAFLDEKQKNGIYLHKFDHPTTFRVDRIKKYRRVGQKFSVPYASRFEEGEFRKRIQFMFVGDLLKAKLKYYGKNPEFILDRIPTARIVENSEEYIIIEAEVYGKGLMMWLLSQGKQVEVVSPDCLRLEIRAQLLEMLERYQD